MNTYIKNSLLLFLSEKDFNETEYLTVKSVLKKSDYKIFIASDAYSVCTGSEGLKVSPDVKLFNVNEQSFAGIVIIGGAGIKKYWDNPILLNAVKSFDKSGKLTAAICSASVAFARAGILKNKDSVCYPSDKTELEKSGANYIDKPIVISGNIITGKDTSASFAFASLIVAYLKGKL